MNAQSQRFPFVRSLIDVAAIFCAATIAYRLRFGLEPIPQMYLLTSIVGALGAVLHLIYTRSYQAVINSSVLNLIKRVIVSNLLTFLILFASMVFLKLSGEISRLWLVTWFVLNLMFLSVVACCSKLAFGYLARHGIGVKRVLIVGFGDELVSALSEAEQQFTFGYKICDVIKISGDLRSDAGLLENLYESSDAHSADEIWISLPLSLGFYIEKVTYFLRHSTAEIRYIPQLDDLNILNHKSNYIAGFYAIDLSCSPLSGISQYAKRVEDILITLLLLPIIIPACLVISVLVRFSSPGEVIFKQQRHGLNGKPFKVYKFRTMVKDRSSSGIVMQATKGDSRITRTGRFLRKTSLDELPQFFNVLQGRMSIAGPRPHALQHNEYYKDLVESYMWRHKVKPGITGWAQVNGLRGETDTLEKMKKRVDADLWYIENWSLWLDLKIIALTVIKGFFDKNAY